MTTVLDDNVQNLAIEESFDDCSLILKTIFNDLAFRMPMTLVQSIQLIRARVLAQVVYYFSAYVQLGSPERFRVVVPTATLKYICRLHCSSYGVADQHPDSGNQPE
ncbi:MAG: hypothetical protein ACNYPE_10515 [Candidatus Azotimanducaceae bacterium WSBS_2022_MAG_OTU7]